MFQDTHGPEDAYPDPVTLSASPRALALVDAMRGCCHPRVSRLTARLLACDQTDVLHQLQGDVYNLLVLSFGPYEAQRRLQTLQ